VLKIASKCSFIKHKLRFFAYFCLASAASNTFFNSLLRKTNHLAASSEELNPEEIEKMVAAYP